MKEFDILIRDLRNGEMPLFDVNCDEDSKLHLLLIPFIAMAYIFLICAGIILFIPVSILNRLVK